MDKAKSGRSQKTSAMTYCKLVRISQRNPRLTELRVWQELSAEGKGNVSVRTAQCRLVNARLHG